MNTTPAPTIHDARRRRRARRGVAALEAVIVLPLMVFIIIGGVEMYLYTRVIAVMDRVAFTLANSMSVQTQLAGSGDCKSPNQLCTYGAIMPTLLTPLAARKAAVIISVYATDRPSSGAPTAWTNISSPNHGWTRTVYRGADAAAPSSRISASNLPTAIISNNTQTADTVIAVEVFYEYQPFAMSRGFFNLLFNPHQYSRALIRPRYADLCRLTDDPNNSSSTNTLCGS
ncbi:TadE family protein [uncultured Castellaniella sp.]|uniref:TadE/TadG family type IV pilus assembly protein n=1 Tax=uncultured Castellaniella sp. TaxID=647907 RepID=UPI0026142275|nr:TadE family protein [uncultured Castellaniella sp.]